MNRRGKEFQLKVFEFDHFLWIGDHRRNDNNNNRISPSDVAYRSFCSRLLGNLSIVSHFTWEQNGFPFKKDIDRIANAVQCHSLLSGHYDCHALRFSKRKVGAEMIVFLLPLSSNFSKLWIFTSDHVWLLSSCKEPLTCVLKQGLIFQTWQNTVKHHRRCAASQNAQNILRKIGGDSMQFVWRNNTDAVQACWWQKLKKKNVGGTNWNYSGVVESVAWQQSDTMSVTLPGVQLLRLKDRAKIQEQYNCIK